MENSENKKSSEELADEALDKVAGGRIYSDHGVYYCSNCGASFPPGVFRGKRGIRCPFCEVE